MKQESEISNYDAAIAGEEFRFVVKSDYLGLFFYTLFLKLYPVGIRVAAIWNNKAKFWLRGRKKFPSFVTPDENLRSIWMHCASLGEFEQGRPLIEKVKKDFPGYPVIITFFSPSGYEIQKNFPGADGVFYLPMDSPSNAKRFIDLVDPALVLWVRYEYWYYYLHELKKRNIPTLLVSGSFRSSQPFFKWYGAFWRKMLGCFTGYFMQNENSKKLLESIGIENVIVSGDTRFDRVISIAENPDPVPGIKEFCGNSRVLVAGSTWEDDEAELIHFVRTHPEIKFIIAPHEIDSENLAQVKREFKGSIFYSELLGNMVRSNTLIIDNIGMLSRLYYYADITYVGGGFGYDGLHNILEAAVYGKPVIFGPETERNFEADELAECGGGFMINNALELERSATFLLDNPGELKKSGDASKAYVLENAGATLRILQYIQENRLLTS